MNNGELAFLLDETADLLEFTKANVFKIRALRRAAHVIDNLKQPIRELYQAGKVTTIPGLGKGMEERIGEALGTGDFQEHRELVKEVPPGLLEMTRLDGVGPATAQMFHQKLGITTMGELEAACLEGKVRELPRMGEKREARILEAIAHYRQIEGQHLVSQAEPVVERLLEELGRMEGVSRVDAAGQWRRRKETIGELILVAAVDAGKFEGVIDQFTGLQGVSRVVSTSTAGAAVIFGRNLEVSLQVVQPDRFGAALYRATGSQSHHRALGEWSGTGESGGRIQVTEEGIFRGGEPLDGGKTEEEFFEQIGLPWIPPELRENKEEIQAALTGTLPRLVTMGDIKGDLHMHTLASDGQNTVEELAAAAIKMGLEYIAITDHSSYLTVAGGLNAAELAEQGEIIGQVQASLDEGADGPPLRILRGVEADILPDGSMDLGKEVLAGLDCVIGSIHSSFQMEPAQMTRRLIRAIKSGVIDILGHPTGVLLSRRAPLKFDMEEVLQAAQEHGVMMELNCNPDRLDLNSGNCRRARELGVMVAVNTDAHRVSSLDLMKYGVRVARRGWLEPGHIANCLPFDRLIKLLARHHPHLRDD